MEFPAGEEERSIFPISGWIFQALLTAQVYQDSKKLFQGDAPGGEHTLGDEILQSDAERMIKSLFIKAGSVAV